jgi:hypothetical protein
MRREGERRPYGLKEEERSASERGLEARENREPEGGLLFAVILEMLADVLSERLGVLAIDQHVSDGSL